MAGNGGGKYPDVDFGRRGSVRRGAVDLTRRAGGSLWPRRGDRSRGGSNGGGDGLAAGRCLSREGGDAAQVGAARGRLACCAGEPVGPGVARGGEGAAPDREPGAHGGQAPSA
jgi:hypothetical protein